MKKTIVEIPDSYGPIEIRRTSGDSVKVHIGDPDKLPKFVSRQAERLRKAMLITIAELLFIPRQLDGRTLYKILDAHGVRLSESELTRLNQRLFDELLVLPNWIVTEKGEQFLRDHKGSLNI